MSNWVRVTLSMPALLSLFQCHCIIPTNKLAVNQVLRAGMWRFQITLAAFLLLWCHPQILLRCFYQWKWHYFKVLHFIKARKSVQYMKIIQTRPGPSSLLEGWSKTPIVFVVLLCCRLPPKLGETAKVYR